MMSSQYETITGTARPFLEYSDPPPTPLDLFQAWIEQAEIAGVREPLALSLATTDSAGRCSQRTVAVTDISANGLSFSTHTTSRKARELQTNSWASGLFYWRELARQLIVSGPVLKLNAAIADKVWDERAEPLKPMSTASHQSLHLDDPEVLLARSDSLGLRTNLARPHRFAVYQLQPHRVEFWAADQSRLHRRLLYERSPHGWTVDRLQP